MVFFDTETCGFHGPTVLIQYAFDDGEIMLWDIFYERVCEKYSKRCLRGEEWVLPRIGADFTHGDRPH